MHLSKAWITEQQLIYRLMRLRRMWRIMQIRDKVTHRGRMSGGYAGAQKQFAELRFLLTVSMLEPRRKLKYQITRFWSNNKALRCIKRLIPYFKITKGCLFLSHF